MGDLTGKTGENGQSSMMDSVNSHRIRPSVSTLVRVDQNVRCCVSKVVGRRLKSLEKSQMPKDDKRDTFFF